MRLTQECLHLGVEDQVSASVEDTEPVEHKGSIRPSERCELG